MSDAYGHARSWIDAWNRHDLDAILEHYTDDVVFEANTVVRRFGKADGILRGKQELREHFRRGLSLAPNLHFDLDGVFTAPSGYAVLYRRENGNRVIDMVEVASDGRARRVHALYESEQL